MSLYAGVDNVARKIIKAYIGVDGVARELTGLFAGVDGVARQCWSGYDPVFENNTWEQIIAACQSGSVPDTWVVGDQKKMLINGTEYAVDIIGKNHDTYTGGGTAPLTFQMHDCYVEKNRMHNTTTNANVWTACDMKKTHLPALLALMPDAAQAAVKPVSKKTAVGRGSSTITTSSETLFLLSEVEVDGAVVNSYSGEGSQYAYYAEGRSMIKYAPSSFGTGTMSTTVWWLRSPRNTGGSNFCTVSKTGVVGTATATGTYGVAPAFCF